MARLWALRQFNGRLTLELFADYRRRVIVPSRVFLPPYWV